jgi:hypothetical protein
MPFGGRGSLNAEESPANPVFVFYVVWMLRELCGEL